MKSRKDARGNRANQLKKKRSLLLSGSLSIEVSLGGSKYYAGLYASDLDAAHAVNRECDRLMITRRNPGIGDPPADLKKKQVRKKAARVSRYLGVSWCKNANKWQARVWHKGKYPWAGYYESDK